MFSANPMIAAWNRAKSNRSADCVEQDPSPRSPLLDGGAEGDRTPDLRNAIATLSQLSYGPVPFAFRRCFPRWKRGKFLAFLVFLRGAHA